MTIAMSITYLISAALGTNEIFRLVNSLVSDALGDNLPQIRCPAVVVDTGKYKVDLASAWECRFISQFFVLIWRQ